MRKQRKCYRCAKEIQSEGEYCPFCGAWVRSYITSDEKISSKKSSNVRKRDGSDNHVKLKTDYWTSSMRNDLFTVRRSKLTNLKNKIIDMVSCRHISKTKITAFLLFALAAGSVWYFTKNRDMFFTDSSTSTTISQSQECVDVQPIPQNGHIFVDSSNALHNSSITIHNSSQHCLVKLKNTEGTTALSFFVRANTTTSIDVPSRKYYVLFAFGDEWYGIEQLFGKNTKYYKDPSLIDFSEGNPAQSGNSHSLTD